MIPTIEDIVKGLQNGSIGYAEAVAWLHQHAEFNDEKYQRYETFKAVALAFLTWDVGHAIENMSSFDGVVGEWSEKILSSAQEFSVKEGKE